MPVIPSIPIERPKANLSCLQCHQRKKKCDKSQPCQACKENGIACTAVCRARLPRGRQVTKSNGIDLRQRIATLERLIANNVDFGQDVASADVAENSPNTGDLAWAAAGEEVLGIRELLDRDSLSHGPYDQVPSVGDILMSTAQDSELFLYGNEPYLIDPRSLTSPSKAETFALLDIYTHRIDPILKVTHVPSLRTLLLGCSAPTYSQEAFRFSVYFTAVCGLDDGECIEILGAGRMETMARFRLAAEFFFSRASLLTTTDWTVLQAFVVYLVGRRICNGPRSVRILIAMAIRLGQVLGLDGRLSGVLTYDIEMRHRVWWSLGILDLQAAFDAGLRPVFVGTSLAVTLPMHINDVDIQPDRNIVSTSKRTNFTDMIFAAMTHAMLRSMGRLNHVPVDFEGRPLLGQRWTERRAIADNSARLIREEYLIHCDPNVPIQLFTRTVGEGMIVTLQLLLRCPMHRFYSSGPPPNDDFDIFNVALNAVQKGLQKYKIDTFRPWRWFAWTKWYALAVLLTEMCKADGHTRNEQAWEVVEAGFAEYGESIDEGSLRVALNKLMGKARSIRFSTIGPKCSSGVPNTDIQASSMLPEYQRPESTDKASSAAGHVLEATNEPTQTLCMPLEEDLEMMTVDWDAFLRDLDDTSCLDTINGCS